MLILNSLAVEPNFAAFARERHDANLPRLLQPGVISSYG